METAGATLRREVTGPRARGERLGFEKSKGSGRQHVGKQAQEGMWFW